MTTFVTRTLTWTPGQAATETVDSTEQKSEAEQRASDFFSRFSKLAAEGTQPVYVSSASFGWRPKGDVWELKQQQHSETLGYWGLRPDSAISSDGDVVARANELLTRVVPPTREDREIGERALKDWTHTFSDCESFNPVLQSVLEHNPTWYKNCFLRGEEAVSKARGWIDITRESYDQRLARRHGCSEDMKRKCFGRDHVDNLTLLRTDPKSPEWCFVKPALSYDDYHWNGRIVVGLSEAPGGRLRIDGLSQLLLQKEE